MLNTFSVYKKWNAGETEVLKDPLKLSWMDDKHSSILDDNFHLIAVVTRIIFLLILIQILQENFINTMVK